MNEEVSHVAQWLELAQRARNFGLRTDLDGAQGFSLWKVGTWGCERIGETYETLADLRAAISDYVAQERLVGRMQF